MTGTDNAFWTRVRELLLGAVLRLDADDRDERIMHCRTTGEHGIRAHVLGDGWVAFWWGGKPLVHVEQSLLADDSAGLAPQDIDIPDTVPEEWTGEA